MSKQGIEVSTWTIVKVLLFIVGFIALYVIRDVVLILLLSIVIASAIDPGVRKLQQVRFPRPLAVLSIYIAAIAVFAFVFYLLVPPLIGELRNFATTFPASLERIFSELQLRLNGSFFVSADTLTERLNMFINGTIAAFFSAGSSVGSSLFGGVLSFVFVVVLSFYFAVQEHGIANFLKIVTPLKHEAYVINLWARSQGKIGKWLQGQLLLGVLVGILVYLGLLLLGVKYALILALFAAIFEIIPIFGPILAAIPSVILAFIQAPVLGVWVVVLYVFVQQMENHLIYPLVVRKAVGVPPLLVIIALLVGGKLGGFIGFVLAVPIASVLLEYINDVVKEKRVFSAGGGSASRSGS